MRDKSFKEFLLDQLGGLPDLQAKAMFGGYGLYQGERFFGILLGGRVFLKTDAASVGDYLKRGMGPFTYNKPRRIVSTTYYEVPPDVLENRDELLVWARRSIAIAGQGPRERTKPQKLPRTCEICILAGGLSKRMGREKAQLKLGRETMLGKIENVAGQSGLPVRVIRRDCVQRCGPLGGILTALKSSQAQAVLFLACDMPFVTVPLLRRLLAAFDIRDALFVRMKGEIGFPFILRLAVLPKIEEQIERGEFSLHRLAAVLKAKLVRLPKGMANQLCNINTPQELEAARKKFQTPTLNIQGSFKFQGSGMK